MDDRRPYDEGTQELAYQLWAYQCSRRVRDVVRALERDATGRIPDEHTVRRWVREQDWPARVADDIRLIAPDMTMQVIVDLVAGRNDAVAYLRRVVRHASEPAPFTNDRGQVLTGDGEWIDVPARFVPSKDAITAAIALVDRGGLSHMGTRADPTQRINEESQPTDDAIDYGALSVEELMQLERSQRSKLREVPRTRRALVIS